MTQLSSKRPKVLGRKQYSSDIEYKEARLAQLAYDIKAAKEKLVRKNDKVAIKQKALLGEFLYRKIETNQFNDEALLKDLNVFLKRKADRELFKEWLQPLEK